MPSRYVQIALTYTRPWPLRIWAMAAAAGMLWMVCALVFMPVDFGVQATILLTGGIMAVWVGAMITSHAKEQLADPRASLGAELPHAAPRRRRRCCSRSSSSGWRCSSETCRTRPIGTTSGRPAISRSCW
jgi:hypothetical protein